MAPNEALMQAVINDQVEEVRQLIADGANPNAYTDCTEGFTPLHLAALYNAIQSARVLVAAGANIDATTNAANITALDIAEQHKHKDFAEILRHFSERAPVKE